MADVDEPSSLVTPTSNYLAEKNGNFICGVVEGFYGRPWTTEQRKDLFRKLKSWGMDSYVYGPKDDYKHRAYWRELYTVEEADHLTSLIASAKEHGIVFYYALSPGLDMIYSCPKELGILKKKLEQVAQFGCEAFALLFDDIEPEMSKADKDAFQSFAHAQVSVTNEVFNHLNCPRFLFCPTQYCSSRAVPTVEQSEYLNTLGTKLAQEIDILWTGTKVISKILTTESIREISDVIRRPPVIWDNLHANDYDQRRVFLGPYSGRSPELIPMLRGVLTNPNCEYHANTIAIHTLASWAKCSTDIKVNDALSAVIKLETENEEGDDDTPRCVSNSVYQRRQALKNALNDWLPEFFIEKVAWGPITKPQPQVTMVLPIIPIIPSINTCMSLTTNTTTSTMANTLKVPEVNTTQLQALADVCSTAAEMTPITTAVMNSLVSATKVVTNDSLPNPIITSMATNLPIPSKMPVSSLSIPIMALTKSNYEASGTNIDSNAEKTGMHLDDAEVMNESEKPSEMIDSSRNEQIEKENSTKIDEILSSTSVVEPMECGSSVTSLTSPKLVAKSPTEDVVMSENASTSSGSMQIESSDLSLTSSAEMIIEDFDRSNERQITVEDLSLLCDLFFLPFEHGNKGLQLLNDFHWLKMNAVVLVTVHKPDQDVSNGKPEVQEWFRKSEKFDTLCKAVLVLTRKIAECANKELCYDLFSYVWDMAGIVTLLNAFIKWLALGYFPININSYTQGSYTWFTKGWEATFASGEQEPWVFRGGLSADLQRLIPIDAGTDLLTYKLPEVPSSNIYTFRPYRHTDEEDVYTICYKTCRDGFDCGDIFSENLKAIVADRLVGPFVTFIPELCLVVQDMNNTTVGFACAALDAKDFHRNEELCWIPAMLEKYPISLLDSPDMSQMAKETVNYFHNFKVDIPSDVLNPYPSVITCSILNDHQISLDQSISKRLITVLLAALRSNGSFGAHVRLNHSDRNMHQFYVKLGFNEIYQDVVNNCTYLARNF